MKISLICVYNNEKQLKEQLTESLKLQIGDIETVLMDSKKLGFKSASEALNYGAETAKGDVLIFSHQDIYIKEVDGIEKLALAIEGVEIGDIVGTQGVREKSKVYYSNLTAGKEFNPSIVKDYNEELIEVSCVDEGLFGMKKETWVQHHFDESLCDNWHLYAVEQALNARKNGHKVWVYPVQMHHFSFGTISLSYMNGLKKLCGIYRKNFKYIWTTCYKVKTSRWYINSLVFLWLMNRKLRGRNF